MPGAIIPQSNTEDRRASPKPLTLIQPDISHDTIEALEYLLHEARKGELIGLAYGAMLKGKDYFVHTTGEANRNPLLGIGIASVLWRRLSDLENGEPINA